MEVAFELVVTIVVIALDGGVLDRAVHPFDLPVGPRMVDPGKAMLDVVLTPRQNSSGGKERLGRISKMGDRYLRKLLVVGAHAVLRHRRKGEDALRTWASRLLDAKPFRVVAIAVANKLARIAFTLMRSGSRYRGAAA